MKVISHNGRILGKTKLDVPSDLGLEITPFDPSVPEHKKAKFLTELPTLPDQSTSRREYSFIGSAWEWLVNLNKTCNFQSIERKGAATNSELKRWLESGVVLVNGEKLEWDERMDFPLISVVMFPSSNRRCTLL